jgi:hypothetical protein
MFLYLPWLHLYVVAALYLAYLRAIPTGSYYEVASRLPNEVQTRTGRQVRSLRWLNIYDRVGPCRDAPTFLEEGSKSSPRPAYALLRGIRELNPCLLHGKQPS